MIIQNLLNYFETKYHSKAFWLHNLEKNQKFARYIPFSYQPSLYNDTFLVDFPKQVLSQNEMFSSIPRQVVSFWTGNNPMSENRAKHFEALKQNIGVPVILVTPDNLADYILPDYPLHEGFEYLSLVHKSDYLRCYFMHHYGGGYSDIKAAQQSWVEAFDVLEKSDSYILGCSEIKLADLAPVGGRLGQDMKRYFSQLIWTCAYISRPHTPFTHEWYTQLHHRLDLYLPQLKENPGNILGDNEGYPIPWTNILGDIFHPLCLKYMEKVIKYPNIRPSVVDYR